MNASSESGLWATWMVIGIESAARDAPGFFERGVDVVLVEEILVEGRGALRGLGGDEAL